MRSAPAALAPLACSIFICAGVGGIFAQEAENARLIPPPSPPKAAEEVLEIADEPTIDPADREPAAVPDIEPTIQPALEEEIEVREVLLDALVTDRKGNVILGLGREDFIVEEEGVEVEIASVDFYSHRENFEESSPVGTDDATPPRYLVFFFHDNTRNDPRQIARLRDAANDTHLWIRDRMLPNDLVAIVSYDFKLKVHQDFTRDRTALSEAAERALRGRDPGGNWPSRRPETGPGEEPIPSILDHLPDGRELRRETGIFSDGVRVLAQATGHIPARKTFLLFSQGFEGSDDRGPWRPDARYYPPMTETLNDNNVAVYTVNLARPNTRSSNRDSLNALALDTGGRFYETVLSFSRMIGLIDDENGGYYLLSYRSETPRGESGYREVTVRPRNRELRVSGRQGFRYGPG